MTRALGIFALGALFFGMTACRGDAPKTRTTLSGVTALSAADWYTCALLADGTVRCWGYGAQGQLGSVLDQSDVAIAVPGVVGAVGIAAGATYACAALSDGTVKCWGRVPGLGDLVVRSNVPPYTVTGVEHAVAVASGRNYACALQADGKVRCWGDNALGVLGTGTHDTSMSPVEVSNVEGATAISTGSDHACALLGDSSVKCWGAGWHTSSGTVDHFVEEYTYAIDAPSPALVAGLGAASAVSAGNNFTCALQADATVQCWGVNGNGNLGDLSDANRATPASVSGLGGVQVIACGDSHACALRDDGSVSCWGNDLAGQTGGESRWAISSLTTVQGLAGARGVSAGYSHTCAILTDSSVGCWGTAGSPDPQQPGTLDPVLVEAAP